MKYIFKLTNLSFVVAFSLLLACCGAEISSRYTLKLPELPEPWVSLLGEPHWRLEWLDKNGQKQMSDILPGQSASIELPVTWTNPVTAWPYWPGHNLIPGLFKPAGALFPFDVPDRKKPDLRLSWNAGRDTVFYWELGLAALNKNPEDGSVKIPANFDWQRFRELFEQDALSESVREDPWLINWRFIAEKTIESSFDRRRLVPEAVQSVSIPVPSGPWYGTSPFAGTLQFSKNETPVFPVRTGLNVWISREGILRISGKTWIFTAWE